MIVEVVTVNFNKWIPAAHLGAVSVSRFIVWFGDAGTGVVDLDEAEFCALLNTEFFFFLHAHRCACAECVSRAIMVGAY